MDYAKKLRDELGDGKDWFDCGDDRTAKGLRVWKDIMGDAVKPPKKIECVCGHKISHNCYIKHRHTNEIRVVGNCCIKRFEGFVRGSECNHCGANHKNRKFNLCNVCKKDVCGYYKCGTCSIWVMVTTLGNKIYSSSDGKTRPVDTSTHRNVCRQTHNIEICTDCKHEYKSSRREEHLMQCIPAGDICDLCGDEYTRGRYNHHTTQCSHADVICKCCGKQYLRKDRDIHFNECMHENAICDGCPLGIVKCLHCDNNVQRNDPAHHDNCMSKIMPCDDCYDNMPVRDLPNHKCEPNAITYCDDCCVKFTKRDLSIHNRSDKCRYWILYKIIQFGKYKNTHTTYERVLLNDRSYIVWLCGNTDMLDCMYGDYLLSVDMRYLRNKRRRLQQEGKNK